MKCEHYFASSLVDENEFNTVLYGDNEMQIIMPNL